MSHFLDLILGTSCISAYFACFLELKLLVVYFGLFTTTILTGRVDWTGLVDSLKSFVKSLPGVICNSIVWIN